MKILMINKYYYLKGGAERYVFELTKLLEANGHKVIPFSMKNKANYLTKYEKYFINEVNLNRFNLANIIKFFYNYQAVKKLKKLIKREKPDIAHLHNIAHQISPAIIKVLKKSHLRIIMTLHDYKLICPNYRLYSKNKVCYKCLGGKYYNCLRRKCLKNSWSKSFLAMLEAYLNNRLLKIYDLVDLYIAPSQFMKKICVKSGMPKNKIKVIYNFIDSNKEQLKNKVQGGYILYFGRLSPEKGIEVLLEAMGKIKVKINLKIVGDGPEGENLKSIISNLKLENRVELAEAKNGHELKRIIGQAKAIIMPSLWPENMPYSLLESLAMGKIVIASKIGGLPEIITDGQNGFLFKSGDSRELAQKMNLILNNKQLVKIIEQQALDSIKKFKPQGYYNKIITIYKQLISLTA